MKISEFAIIYLIVLGITGIFSTPPENIESVADRKVAKINVPERKDSREILRQRVPRSERNLTTGLNCSSKGDGTDTEEQHVQRSQKTLMLKSPELAEKQRTRCREYYARQKALMLKSPELAEKKRKRRKEYHARKKALMLKSPELAEKERKRYREYYARKKALMLKSPELAEQQRKRRKEYYARRKALMLKSPELAEKERKRQKEFYASRKALRLKSRQLTEDVQNKRIELENCEVEVGPLAEEHWYKQLKIRYPELAANLTEVKEEPWIERIKPSGSGPVEEGAPSEVAEDQWYHQIKLSSPTGRMEDQWNKPIKSEFSEVVEKQSVLNEQYKTVSEKCLKPAKLGESSGQITTPVVTPWPMEMINNTYKIATPKVEQV